MHVFFHNSSALFCVIYSNILKFTVFTMTKTVKIYCFDVIVLSKLSHSSNVHVIRTQVSSKKNTFHESDCDGMQNFCELNMYAHIHA